MSGYCTGQGLKGSRSMKVAYRIDKSAFPWIGIVSHMSYDVTYSACHPQVCHSSSSWTSILSLKCLLVTTLRRNSCHGDYPYDNGGIDSYCFHVKRSIFLPTSWWYNTSLLRHLLATTNSMRHLIQYQTNRAPFYQWSNFCFPSLGAVSIALL